MSSLSDVIREFGIAPFSTAEAQRRAITPGVLRNPALHRQYRGARMRGDSPARLAQRALAYLPLLRPGDCFSHATALALLGCPIRVASAAPIDVEAAPGAAQPRRRGVLGHRRSEGPQPFSLELPGLLGRVPVSAPLRAVQQAAGQLPFCELIVALDYLLRANGGVFDPLSQVDPVDLEWAVAQSAGPHAARFRIAAGLARVGAESRMETLTRLCGEAVGLSGLTLQRRVHGRDGSLIGRFDLADEETRSLYEYDGEQHRLDRKQYLRDLDRFAQVAETDWRPLRLHREQVLGEPIATGHRMLRHAGREPSPVSAPLRRLLAERSGRGTEAAQ